MYLNQLPPITGDAARDAWRMAFSTWRRARLRQDVEAFDRATRMLRLLSRCHDLPMPATLLWHQGSFKAAGTDRVWVPQVNRSMTMFCRKTRGSGHHTIQRRHACQW